MTKLLVTSREDPDAERMNHRLGTNQTRKPHLPNNLKLAKERVRRRLLERKPKPRNQKKVTVMVKSCPMCHSEDTRDEK